MSGLDINDKLSSNHSIILNGAWDNDGPFYFNNNAFFSNDLAIYAGVGERKDNVIYYNNTFSDNVLNIQLATYHTVEQSMLIADSGHGNLLGANTLMYKIYDGAGQMYNNHMVGWDGSRAIFLKNVGAAEKHANHRFSGFTWDHAGLPRNVHPSYSNAMNPIVWAQVIYDIDGSVSGLPGASLIAEHSFMVVGNETKPANWENNLVSPNRFARLRSSYGSFATAQSPLR